MGNETSVFNKNYIISMRPVFNKSALFSDTTRNYISPEEPAPYDEVRIRLRTGRNNVDAVYIEHEEVSIPMHRIENGEALDLYEATIKLEDKKYSYCFRIQVGSINCFYDTRGFAKEISEYCNFVIIPGFKTPGWAKNAVMYQIFIDRFYNGDTSNDVLDHEYHYLGDYSRRVPPEEWDKFPDSMGVREFYGGDLQGVLDKMDYLKSLDIDAIYFNPLFVSPSNHKYDIQDYDYIDPHLGKLQVDEGEVLSAGQTENSQATKYISRVTDPRNLEAANQLFIKVIEEAHKRGIRVVMDGVFNHCGSFNKWMDRERIYEKAKGYEKGAYVLKESPYHNYFLFQNKEEGWPYNATYDGWWGHDTLPKLHYEGDERLFDYMMHIAEKWVSAPYYADGWRLDVAADLGNGPESNHFFWTEFRKHVKKANPNAIILAEHYGDPSAWLQGDQWDSVMNYDAFMEPVTWFLTGMEKHSDDFRDDLLGNAEAFWNAIEYNKARMSEPSALTCMNEISNHDHSRFLTRTNHCVGRSGKCDLWRANQSVNKAIMREAVVMQFTWPGIATIYYGDEAGLCGFTDPDNRRTYPWGKEDHRMIAFHKAIIKIHKRREEFICGSIKSLAGEKNYLAYGRFTRRSVSVILINNNDFEIEVKVPVWIIGVPKKAYMKRLLLSDAYGFYEDGEMFEIKSGILYIKLPATSAEIISFEKNKKI